MRSGFKSNAMKKKQKYMKKANSQIKSNQDVKQGCTAQCTPVMQSCGYKIKQKTTKVEDFKFLSRGCTKLHFAKTLLKTVKRT